MKAEQWRKAARVTWRAYGFAIVMAGFSFIPGCNLIFYSGHGGLAFLLLPFVFPFALLMLFLEYKAAVAEEKRAVRTIAVGSVVAYFPVAFAAAKVQEATFGYTLELKFLWGLFIMLFVLPFVWSFFAL
jgi:hypothetical protein